MAPTRPDLLPGETSEGRLLLAGAMVLMFLTGLFVVTEAGLGVAVAAEVTHRTAELNSEVVIRRRLEAMARESEARLDLALRGSRLALWDLEVASGRVFLSDDWADILGQDRSSSVVQIASLKDSGAPRGPRAHQHGSVRGAEGHHARVLRRAPGSHGVRRVEVDSLARDGDGALVRRPRRPHDRHERGHRRAEACRRSRGQCRTPAAGSDRRPPRRGVPVPVGHGRRAPPYQLRQRRRGGDAWRGTGVGGRGLGPAVRRRSGRGPGARARHVAGCACERGDTLDGRLPHSPIRRTRCVDTQPGQPCRGRHGCRLERVLGGHQPARRSRAAAARRARPGRTREPREDRVPGGDEP